MELVQTMKVRILFQKQEDIEKMKRTMLAYRDGCNLVSQYIFDQYFPLNYYVLNKALYHKLRKEHSLKANMAQSCMKTTIAEYESLQSNLKKQKEPFSKEPKSLEYLWSPIQFQRPQLDLVRNRDYSLITKGKNAGMLSLNTLEGRVYVKPIYKGWNAYIDKTWKIGTAKVIHKQNHWFLHIACSKEVPDVELSETKTIVGIDRGIRKLVTCYDSDGNTTFVNGTSVSQKREHYKQLRASLQSKNTKSSKRRLRAIGDRENRWMCDVNHCISKTLVNQYGANTLFVLEELEDVRTATVKVSKSRRYEQVSWAYYDLEKKLTYKAHANGSEVIKVDPHYTSQRCPKCGRIHKPNRNHDLHQYTCDACNYSSNDDRIGAMNLLQLGERYLTGEKNPKFRKETTA